jgi:hypothetical protein
VLTRYDLMAARPWNVGLHRYIDRRTLCDLIVEARSHRGWSDVEAAEHVIARAFDHFFTSHGGTPDHLFVEKTPDHLFHAHRILRSFPDARVVEVVRDGRDVCASMQRLVEREWWPPSDRPAQIETWLRHIERGAALRADAAFVDRVLQVRYEAVRADPSREISRLFAFAGLDAAPEQVARIVAATDIARGAPRAAGHPPHRGRVGGWRDHFTAEDTALFRHLAGEACRQLGYEL